MRFFHNFKHITLITFLFSFFVVSAQKKEELIFDGIMSAGGQTIASNMKIEVIKKNGKKEKITVDSKGKFEIKLDFYSEYEIIFSKDGFMGNIIKINTEVDKMRIKEGFPAYELNIDLKPEIEGRKSNITYDVSYSDYNNNFDFKEDYKKVTNKHVKEIKDEVALDKKLKEQAKIDSLANVKAQKAEEERLKREAAEKARLEALAAEQAKKAEEERLRKEAAEKARLEALAAAEAKKAEEARLKKEAEDKAKQNALTAAEAKKAEEERKRKEQEEAEKARLDALAKEKAEIGRSSGREIV